MILWEAYNPLWVRRAALVCVGLIVTICTCASAHAQGVLGVDPTGRSGDAPPPLLEQQPSRSPLGPILPPIPPPPVRKTQQLPLAHVFVREIKVTGSTVFSPAELASVTTSYVNKELTTEDLEELRLALTRLYVNKGYINSGAIIPDQTVTDGVITLHVIEGKLTRVEVEGNRWFRAAYIQDRLVLGAGPPVNLNALQHRLQLLQQDARIQRLNAELHPGVKLGESVLRVRVQEERPYTILIGFNNYQSPTVGAERGLVTVMHQNLTGHGDPLSVTYGRSTGIDPQIDASYAFPFTARDTTAILQYRKNDFIVVEDPFAPLDVESESEIYGVTLRQPFYRTPNQEFALELTGERLYNKTFLLGEPFSFSPGAKNGKSTVTALRFSLEWTDRTQNQVLAARSRFSVGIDALGATNNGARLSDGQFFAWLGQFQWARRLDPWDIQTILRLDLQLTTDSLLPLEQIAVGGRFSVRGYRENQLVRDNGLVASLESRIPLIREQWWADVVQLAPFVDVGRAWNTNTPTFGPQTIASVGIGLRWAGTWTYLVQFKPELEVYWGLPLRHIKTSGGDLQDAGVHLQFIVAAL